MRLPPLPVCRLADHTFLNVERALRDRGLLDQSLHQIMRSVRTAGNEAVPELSGSRREAFHQLKLVRQLAVWFHKTVTGNLSFKPGPFTPPPDPTDADDTLKEQLQKLREALAKKQAELEGIQLEASELNARVEATKAEAASTSQGILLRRCCCPCCRTLACWQTLAAICRLNRCFRLAQQRCPMLNTSKND